MYARESSCICACVGPAAQLPPHKLTLTLADDRNQLPATLKVFALLDVVVLAPCICEPPGALLKPLGAASHFGNLGFAAEISDQHVKRVLASIINPIVQVQAARIRKTGRARAEASGREDSRASYWRTI